MRPVQRPSRPSLPMSVHALVALAVLALVMAMVAGPMASADEAEAEVEVDDWGRDPNSLSGTIDEVCGPGPTHDAASVRPGRVALISWLGESFPEVQGFAGFACREIHNRRMDCAGRDRPDRSNCWSTHAAGRAIDVMVGGAGDQDGYPVGGELGDRIVNHLLERVHGIDNYRARVMGIQQLLWNGTCWNSSRHGDAGITDVSQLDDDCVDHHDNHVHITLSEAGADGLTSFHTGGEVLDIEVVEAEPIRDQWMAAYDRGTGEVLLQELADDGTFTGEEFTDRVMKGVTSVVAPDVGGNGDNELFVYRSGDGAHRIREIRGSGELGSHLGETEDLDPGWTTLATPDVDGDGDDELLLYRADDGQWVLHELLENGELGPRVQAGDGLFLDVPDDEADDDETDDDEADDDDPYVEMDVLYSNAATPDLDGDGDDELVLYRRYDGFHTVWDFSLEGAEVSEAPNDAPDEAPDETQDETQDESADEFGTGVVMDADEDGIVDDGVVLAPLSVDLVPVDESLDAEESDEDAEDEDVEDGEAEAEPLDPADLTTPGTALSAGFSVLTTTDLDHDGRHELALYRDGDGCLAIRTASGADVDDMGVDDESDESDDELAEDQALAMAVQPCLDLEDGDDQADEDADDQDADDQDGDDESLLVTDGLDPDTWLLESPTGLEPGWTALATVSIGDEYVPDPADADESTD